MIIAQRDKAKYSNLQPLKISPVFRSITLEGSPVRFFPLIAKSTLSNISFSISLNLLGNGFPEILAEVVIKG